MKLYNDIRSVNFKRLKKEKYLTIGVYDGLHLGHQLLIEEMVAEAKQRRALTVVLTFDNHPLEVLAPAYFSGRLLAPAHKLELLKKMGPEVIIQVRFDQGLARIPARKFVEKIVVNKISADCIFCGEDFRFGDQGQGNVSLLKSWGKAFGYTVRVIPSVRKRGIKISSTLIRELVQEGEMEEAELVLGRPFEIQGRVVKGAGRGHQLGFPTANLKPSPGMVQPPPGAYAVIVERGAKLYAGMMYIGTRPTFKVKADNSGLATGQSLGSATSCDRIDPLGYEVHIFGKTPALHRKKLRVKLIKWLREEMTFASPKALKAQLNKDAAQARSILSNYAKQRMLTLISPDA